MLTATAGLLLGILLSLWPVLSQAQADPDPAELARQLKALEAEIATFQQQLANTTGKRAELERTLGTNERAISNLRNRINTLQRSLQRGKTRLTELAQKQRDLEQARRQQHEYLIKQIRAAHETGNQPFLKVLLNQEDPALLDRMLTYYDYFNRARVAQMARYQDTIAQLDGVALLIADENRQLTANQAVLLEQRQALQAARQNQQRTLGQLNQAIAATGSKIEQLTQDREHLEALLERITRQLVEFPTDAETATFVSRKGVMPLPVEGTIKHRYGSRRSNDKQRWNGLMIDAPQGTPVTTIHYGRVVFADWLRGFGLLMIISHGDGYMSLYGHNDVLYRETGDWVRAGDTIAEVGSSGGLEQPGLYFEIRSNGEPTNPQQWCKADRGSA